ncbi:MAG: hypothetical protein SFU86_00640 [Pirellulaceae bacterium]|nr:hypothetical protein [Pirellulaceae bacterium]
MSRCARAKRRGFSSVAAILLTVIGIVTLLLVVNWTYLNLASRRMQDLAETLAWSAVYELLDDEKLQDAPVFDQVDDISDTEAAIETPTSGLLAQNNAASGPTLQVTDSDLMLTFGRIENANSPIGIGDFLLPPFGTDPYNTLRVEIFRDPGGMNPVELLIRGFGAPNAAKISGAAYVTLDSRVTAFRPTLTTNAPLAPLAIDEAAWFSSRTAGGIDTNGNGRFELRARLRTTAGTGDFNSVLISLDSAAGLNSSLIPTQVTAGATPADVGGTGLFGPATAASGGELTTDAERDSPTNVAAIATAFSDVAASLRPTRVFPIYSTYGDPVEIVGYVGARILGASLQNISGSNRLVVRVEPEFIVHPTAVTQFTHASATVPENIYIHKIRLTR